MMKNLCIIFLILAVALPTMAESRSEWHGRESVQLAEDFFFLLETAVKEAGPNVKISVDSFTNRAGDKRKILEFRFPDNRIVLFEIYREDDDYATVFVKPVSVFDSYFEPIWPKE